MRTTIWGPVLLMSLFALQVIASSGVLLTVGVIGLFGMDRTLLEVGFVQQVRDLGHSGSWPLAIGIVFTTLLPLLKTASLVVLAVSPNRRVLLALDYIGLVFVGNAALLACLASTLHLTIGPLETYARMRPHGVWFGTFGAFLVEIVCQCITPSTVRRDDRNAIGWLTIVVFLQSVGGWWAFIHLFDRSIFTVSISVLSVVTVRSFRFPLLVDQESLACSSTPVEAVVQRTIFGWTNVVAPLFMYVCILVYWCVPMSIKRRNLVRGWIQRLSAWWGVAFLLAGLYLGGLNFGRVVSFALRDLPEGGSQLKLATQIDDGCWYALWHWMSWMALVILTLCDGSVDTECTRLTETSREVKHVYNSIRVPLK